MMTLQHLPQPLGENEVHTSMRMLLILSLLCVAACGRAPEPPVLTEEARAERDSVIALVEIADPASFIDAFERLESMPYVVLERLEQFTPEGQVSALRERTLLIDGESTLVLESSASGMFDFGSFGRFVSLDDLDHIPENPIPFLIQDDPPYLTPAGKESYLFTFGADTTLGNLTIRTVDIHALPDYDHPLQRAVLYVDPADRHLVGIRLHRYSDTFFFGENSRMSLFLSDDRLPTTAVYDVEIRAALTVTRRFRLTRTYGGAEEVNVALNVE